jgi:UDP-N-acetylmuramate--alanine ligase
MPSVDRQHRLRGSASRTLQPDITYSLRADAGATYFATDIAFQADGTSATIWEEGQPLGQLTLGILGNHNLSNALAAVAVGRQLGPTHLPALPRFWPTFEGSPTPV